MGAEGSGIAAASRTAGAAAAPVRAETIHPRRSVGSAGQLAPGRRQPLDGVVQPATGSLRHSARHGAIARLRGAVAHRQAGDLAETGSRGILSSLVALAGIEAKHPNAADCG